MLRGHSVMAGLQMPGLEGLDKKTPTKMKLHKLSLVILLIVSLVILLIVPTAKSLTLMRCWGGGAGDSS